MPRYLFNVNDGRAEQVSREIQLTDLDAARAQAAELAGMALVDRAEHFWGGQPWSVRVSDSTDLVLFEIHLMAISAPSTLDRTDVH